MPFPLFFRAAVTSPVLVPTATAPVSVVTTAYNHADYILASVNSILAQDPLVREVIVVDDGSPDDTGARLAPLAAAGRIRYVRQTNAGMAAARNAGAALATGEYLYFLDDDDLALPDGLARLVNELERHPVAAFAYGGVTVFDGASSAPNASPNPGMTPDGGGADDGASAAVDALEFLLFNRLWSPGQVLIRRAAFEAVGGFDGSIWGTDDWDLWLRLLERHPARAVSRPVLAYRLHADNASRNIARMYRSSLRVARAHLTRLPANRRVVVRRYAFGLLRHHHYARLLTQVKRDARAGAWRRAATAAGALVEAWALDVGARVALKTHLARRGRWRLTPDEPVFRIADIDA